MLSRKLRISLAEACNLKCFFCHNEGQGPLRRTSAPLSVEDYVRIVDAAVAAGIREIKLTGGEPLLYRDERRTFVDLVRELSQLRGDRQFGLSVTTNGTLLSPIAAELKEAGLDRVTVSLHTLDERRFEKLISAGRRRQAPRDVMASINSAVRAGLTPVKVNMVLFGDADRGNVNELPSVVRECREAGVQELRLYTLIDHAGLEDYGTWYRYWDDGLAGEVSAALFDSDEEQHRFAGHVMDFVERNRGKAYPKPTLVANAAGLDVSIEAMEHNRFDGAMSDEGPYALRLSARGVLSGVLGGSGAGLDLRRRLSDNGSTDALTALFSGAMRDLLPF